MQKTKIYFYLKCLFLFFIINSCSEEPETTVNFPPEIQGTTTFQISEDSVNGDLVGVINAFDKNDDSLSFKILSGNLDNVFKLENINLKLNNAEALDYDKNQVYTLNIEVSDKVNKVNQAFTINIIKGEIKVVKANIKGFVQKGPFVSGSNVLIQEMTETLVSTGKSHTLTTSNDFGEFEFNGDVASPFLEVATTGFYFNEVSGKLVDANLTLRAIVGVDAYKDVNVNVLTTLSKGRIKKLLADGSSFAEAKEKTEQEIIQAFGIAESVNEFSKMDISKEGVSNAVLLAISVVLQEENTISKFSELLSKLNIDFTDDGLLNQNNKEIIKYSASKMNLKLQKVRNNLLNRYQNLGLSSVSVPAFDKYVVKVSDEELNFTSIPTNGENNVLTDSIVLNFNMPVLRNVGVNLSSDNIQEVFELKEGSQNGSSITFTGSINDANTQITIKPNTKYKSETEYFLSLKEPIYDLIENAFSNLNVSFKTKNTYDIEIIENNFITKAVAQNIVMHYHKGSKKMLIFNFYDNQIIRYDPFDKSFDTQSLTDPGITFMGTYNGSSDIYSQLIEDKLYIENWIYDLNSKDWIQYEKPNGTRISLGNFIYGIEVDRDANKVKEIYLFKYDKNTKTQEIIAPLPINEDILNNIQSYDLNLSYVENQNKFFINVSIFSSIGNEGFYYNHTLGSNSITEISKSSDLDAGETDFRDDAAVIYDSTKNSMVIYGGYASYGGYHNDIWIYSFDKNEWSNPININKTEHLESGKAFNSAFVPELNSMFVVGGFGGGSTDNIITDFVRIDLK